MGAGPCPEGAPCGGCWTAWCVLAYVLGAAAGCWHLSAACRWRLSSSNATLPCPSSPRLPAVQLLVAAINKYYAFGSCFVDDAT